MKAGTGAADTDFLEKRASNLNLSMAREHQEWISPTLKTQAALANEEEARKHQVRQNTKSKHWADIMVEGERRNHAFFTQPMPPHSFKQFSKWHLVSCHTGFQKTTVGSLKTPDRK